ncbi:MAG: 4-(cytidine 5'-diphospho)-2-C-methyl-D-erythritol kinase [Fibrobacterota bacterium]
MESKSYTRLTLALDIIRRLTAGPYRGYHELNIIKHQIDLHDIVSIDAASSTVISSNHPRVPCDSSNICFKAVELMKQHYRIDKNVHIHIEKRIPVQGGLAGGSANAATVLAMLNDLWGVGADTPDLIGLARRLGQDVPFYFIGNTALDTEATGILRPVENCVHFDFVLCIPPFGVSTPAAYRSIDYSIIGMQKDKTLALCTALARGTHDEVLPLMHNDFELSVFAGYPALRGLKEKMLDLGCLRVVMSGSGSTLIGVASSRQQAEEIAGRIDCMCIVAETRQNTHVC